MNIAAFLTSLPLPFEVAVAQAAALGFHHIDVVALVERPAGHLAALADAGTVVSCAALGRELPEGIGLDSPSAAHRRQAVDLVKQQIADAARLGATTAYLIPSTDSSAQSLAYFSEACTLLADYAAQRMVRLCIEHIPGRALPTVAATLAWLDRMGHDNLRLLLDVGHCLISGEEPGDAVRQAGPRLGYVHFDDNDGKGDLHWALLTGVLKQSQLEYVAAALQQIRYEGNLALELNPNLADAAAALREGKALLERIARASR